MKHIFKIIGLLVMSIMTLIACLIPLVGILIVWEIVDGDCNIHKKWSGAETLGLACTIFIVQPIVSISVLYFLFQVLK